MDVLVLLVATFIALSCIWVYQYYDNVYTYWKIRRIPYVKPIPIFGNAFSLFAGKLSIGNLFYQIYQISDAPYEGLFILHEPWLLIRNPEIIKTIFVKDFDHFTDRATEQKKTDDKIGSNMTFFLPNPEWKYIRRKMSRTLSTAHLKFLYSYLNNFGDDLISYITIESKTGSVKILNALKKFAVKCLLLYIFGAEEEFTETKTKGVLEALDRIMSPNFVRSIQILSIMLGSCLVKPFGMKFLPSTTAKFFRNLFQEVAKNKRTNLESPVENSIVEYLIHLKQQNTENKFLSDDDSMVAHAVENLVGGVDTVPTAVSCVLFELSLNTEIQDRIRSEIVDNIANEIYSSYNNLNKMHYLDMVIKETMRKYPPFPYLDRRCTKDYQLPGSNTVISKGTKVCMSLQGLHHDPLNFNQPEKFDPERFSKENLSSLPTGSYLPFGIGPRMCIGDQLARFMVKVALVKLLPKFTVHPVQEESLKFSCTSLVTMPSHPPQLDFKEIVN